ncbi:MAG: hypothetical protein WBP03_02350 [Candidatus Saccharimonadales bacterium]
MESLLGTAVFVLAVVWAFRIEKNTARAAESLERLEKILGKKEK